MSTDSRSVPADNPFRLPRTALPRRYDLTIAPDLQRRDFVGQAVIEVEVFEPLATITCNAEDLTVQKAWVVDQTGTRLDATVEIDAQNQRASFTVLRTLAPGTVSLHVQFHGVLNDKLVGFYASTYEAADGSTKVIATTQMESTDARKAFPCWDEPDCKAVFGVTLVVDNELLAVSNMHEISSTVLASGKRSVRFADTPLMSTYLVAFVVGELEATPPVDVDGIPLRVIARPGVLDQSAFALECGAFALRYFQDWYGIPYPGTKLDLIATPDFAFGAMENLGAVTFREMLLLIDENSAARGDLERAADVISHEIAHMWFGDLVTMKWWNGLWLNEAFATFAETSCCAKFRPEWDRWTSFSLARSMAQVVDGLMSTRPIEFPVVSPADAEGMFDVLTYEKGASVLRMLEQYLGEDRFRDGVRHYLRAHSFANAETTDLWDSIEAVTKEPVRETMDGWIFQGGYPLVTASLNTATNELRLDQQRFLYGGAGSSDTQPSWRIPVIYRTSDGTEGRVLLDAAGATLPLPSGCTWAVVNAGGHGFYRVAYDDTLLTQIHAALPTLAAVERYQIVSDTWAAVLAGTTAGSTFLALTEAFGAERNPNVWNAILTGWRELESVAGPETRAALQARFQKLLRPIVNELGWKGDPGEDSLQAELRGQLIGALGTVAADPEILTRVPVLVDQMLAYDPNLDPDLVPAVVGLGARNGDAARYERYRSARDTARTPQETRRLLLALGLFPDAVLAQRTLESTLTDDVRTQDAPFLLATMLMSRENGPVAWDFVESHWAELEAHFPANLLPRFVEGITSLSEPSVADRIETFFESGPGRALRDRSKPVQQHLERLAVHRAFRAREASE